MSIPSPGRKGEVIYILQEEGAAAVTSLTSRAGAQGREKGTEGLLFNRLTAVWGVGHQEEPFFPAGQIGGETSLPSPLCISSTITTCPHILGQQLDNH